MNSGDSGELERDRQRSPTKNNSKKEKKMELTIRDLKEILGGERTAETTKVPHPYEIGKNYHVRTVTMAIAGKLKAVYQNELVFENASWVADSGRFSEYLKDTSNIKENEPFPNDVIIGRGAIIDCTEIESCFRDLK